MKKLTRMVMAIGLAGSLSVSGASMVFAAEDNDRVQELESEKAQLEERLTQLESENAALQEQLAVGRDVLFLNGTILKAPGSARSRKCSLL